MSEKKKIFVLSIDGGGIRGIVPAMILTEIEKLTVIKVSELIQKVESDEERGSLESKLSALIKTKENKKYVPTSELFSMIAGTSTGGILALALSLPDEEKRPVYTAAELVKFYEDDGPEIFKRSWHRVPIISHAINGVRAKYSSKKFRGILKDRFGKTKLSEALCDLIVPSYELVNRIPWFFKSGRAEHEGTYDFLMRDVALATSAAPTYFKPQKIKPILVNNGEPHEGKFIDGGVYANHPAMCAYVEVESHYPDAEIVLVSLGTGEKNSLQRIDKKKIFWGVAWWIKPVVNVIMDGASDTVTYQLKRLLRESENGTFYRFQFDLSEAEEESKLELDMDNASEKNLKVLQKAANDLIDHKKDKLDQLCCKLGKQLFDKLSNSEEQERA